MLERNGLPLVLGVIGLLVLALAGWRAWSGGDGGSLLIGGLLLMTTALMLRRRKAI